MKITVTTPTGNIGHKLTDELLKQGAEVTLLARHPEKVKAFASRGARVVAGDQLDSKAVSEAIRDADALFWLTPPDLQSHDPRGRYAQFARVAAEAIKTRPQLRVVHLSSVGAEKSEGTGLIVGLHDNEEILNAATANVTHVRANYFMENVLGGLGMIASEGAFYSTVPGNVRVPRVATQDIAKISADLLLNGKPGKHVVDVIGPQDISFEEAAVTLSRVLKTNVKHTVIPAEAFRSALIGAGLSPEVAAGFTELDQAVAKGLAEDYGEDRVRRGAVTFDQFAREVVAPVYQKMSVAKAS